MKSELTRGDIVLVPFPFTDLSSGKVRPALVINAFGEDILVAFISSVISPASPGSTDFVLASSHPEFPKTGLKFGSTFKLAKLLCLHRSRILRRLGKVGPALQPEIDLRLSRAVGLT